MVREFKFKGYAIEQLKNMSIESLLPLMNSRQRRSLDKRVGKYMNDDKRKLRGDIKLAREGKINGSIKTHVRDMIILPDMVDLTIALSPTPITPFHSRSRSAQSVGVGLPRTTRG